MQNGIQAKSAAPIVCGNVLGIMYPHAQTLVGKQKTVTTIATTAQTGIAGPNFDHKPSTGFG